METKTKNIKNEESEYIYIMYLWNQNLIGEIMVGRLEIWPNAFSFGNPLTSELFFNGI